MRRLFLQRVAGLAASSLCAPLAWSQSGYPDRPIRMIIPFPPGGSVDPIARVLGLKLGEALGQPIVVDNRPGGNTSIGAGFVAKARPDGYTLLFAAMGTHVIHTLQSTLPYDSIKDFAPVAGVSKSGYILVIHPSVPARTVPEFIAYAKANPGKLNYASSGVGNLNQLACELLNITAGIQMVHVPYKGGGPAVLDLVAGRVQVMFTVVPAVEAAARAGQLVALAYSAEEPNMLPVPTLSHYGLQGFESMGSLNGLLVPAETPAPIVNRLTSAIADVLVMPDVKSTIEAQKQFASYMTPAELGARMNADRARFNDILQKANIKLTA